MYVKKDNLAALGMEDPVAKSVDMNDVSKPLKPSPKPPE